jgi:hypothetical protein
MRYLFRFLPGVIGLTLSLSVLLFACSKDNDKEDDPMPEFPDGKAGEIPGFGEADGEPEGTLFRLPDGVELVEEIRGNENGRSNDDCLYDGQGYNVMVKIKLRRYLPGGSPIRVEFPAGLVIVTTSEGRNQNGLLIEKAIVELPPMMQGGAGSRCDLTLLLVCANQKRDPSSSYHTYKFGPVTNSSLIKDLIKRLSGKKISYSDYTSAQEEQRKTAMQAVQDALYSLTDGRGYNPAVLAEIAKIPNR